MTDLESHRGQSRQEEEDESDLAEHSRGLSGGRNAGVHSACSLARARDREPFPVRGAGTVYLVLLYKYNVQYSVLDRQM